MPNYRVLANPPGDGRRWSIVKPTNTVRNNSPLHGGGFEGDPGTSQDDDPHLQFTAETRTTYDVEFLVLYQATQTADIRFVVAGPVGSVGWLTQANIATGATSATAQAKFEAEPLTLGTRAGATFIVGSEGSNWARLSGLITIGDTGGPVALRWGQATGEVSDAAVLAGSICRYERLWIALAT